MVWPTLCLLIRCNALGLSQTSNSSGQTESLPNPREADKLARAILLCVDMERNQAGTEISESLESLLSPLLETLSRVGTNIYLPVRKSDKSLQLVLRLIQHGKAPRCPAAGEEQGLVKQADRSAFVWDKVQTLLCIHLN